MPLDARASELRPPATHRAPPDAEIEPSTVALDAAIATAPADAPAALDAPVEAATGTIVVTNDVWCEVSIDHGARVRKNPGQPLTLPVAAGHHVVVCEQPGMGRAWTREVDVAAGGSTPASGSLLGDATVTSTIDATIDDVPIAPGGHLVVKPGHHNLAAHGAHKHVEFQGACEVRDQPELACYRLP